MKEKPKRKYTMSDAALAQRREASKLGAEAATGPISDEGKAASSRNAWKHGLRSRAPSMWRDATVVGMFGRPCRTTCLQYPCSLVNEGITKAGGDCLDKTVYVEAFDSILRVVQSGDVSHGHEMLAASLAGAMEVLQQLRAELADNGVVIQMPMVNKQGEIIGHKPEINPAMFHYSKLLTDLGISLPELMATPRAVEKREDAESAADAVQDLFTRALSRANGKPIRRPVVIEGKV